MDRAETGLSNRRSRVPLFALIAALAIGAIFGVRHYLQAAGGAESGSVGRLAKIVVQHRLARGRLSGGFAYAPCPADSTSDRLVRGLVCDRSAPTSWSSASRLRDFASEMRIVGRLGSASDAHTTGIWDLVWGRTDDAVADLRAAVKREPSNARAFNDLAVALSEYAEHHDDPSALIDAFVAADSAVRVDSTLAEARFTHAVLLEQLYLRTDAVDSWKRYLQLDGTSPWAMEARGRVTSLEHPPDRWISARERLQGAASTSDLKVVQSIVTDHPSETRALIDDQLAAWGAAVIAGDAKKSRTVLEFARTLAEPLRVATGDGLMVDAIAAIDQANAKGDAARIRMLAEGHVDLADGIEHFGKRRNAKASVQLARARELLSSSASPMSAWASLFEARLHVLEPGNFAIETLNAIRAATPPRYSFLRSSAAQYVGFVYDTRSDFVHSIAAYDSALLENRSIDEPQITLRVGSWLSQAAAALRGREAGWRALYSALAASPRYSTNDRHMYTVIDYAALATGSDAPRLSLRFCDELIRVARRLADAATISVALRRRAEQLARMGQNDRARSDIDGALTAAQQIEDTTLRRSGIALVTLVKSYIALHELPTEAEPALRRVVDEYKAIDYAKGLGTAYLYLAQSRAALGMLESARATFDSATDVMQRQRGTVLGSAERAAFLDDARATIDQIVAFHASHSESDAFEYFERTRSRVLLEQLADGRGQVPDRAEPALPALQRRLSKNDVVLSYAVLPNELLIWTIGHDRFEMHRVSITEPEIEQLVNRLLRTIRDPSAAPDVEASERLYRLLLASAGQLGRDANLFVIPDRWLHVVPFAALRDGATKRFLIQDYSVSYAPSVTLLTANLQAIHRGLVATSKVLAFGNPKFDARVFSLTDLPAARREAEAIADLYGHQKAVVEIEATDTALEQMAPSFDILHFAGHAVVGRNAPQLSHLVLASDGRSDGAVFASEIARWHLPRTRLVILSGCSTGDGRLSATEGASSLARAFFAAGAPAVVSSLWSIDDDETADFFIAFHRRIVQGHPVAVALRETQIEWLGDSQSGAHQLSSWAGFLLFGT